MSIEGFSTQIDPADIDTIEAVAKAIDPGAWDDRPVLKEAASGYVPDEDATKMFRRVNDSNRERARNIAIDVIAIGRAATPTPGTDGEGGEG